MSSLKVLATLLLIASYINFINVSCEFIQSVTLNTTTSTANHISVDTKSSEVTIGANLWNVDIGADQNGSTFDISMDSSFGFHSEIPSTIALTLHGNTPTTQDENADILLLFTADNQHFFTFIIRLFFDDFKQPYKIYPADGSSLATTFNVHNLIYSNDALNSRYYRWSQDASKTDKYSNINPVYQNVAIWPLHIKIENDPISNLMMFTYYDSTQVETVLSATFTNSFETNQAVNVYIAGTNQHETFTIKSMEIEYTFDTTSSTLAPLTNLPTADTPTTDTPTTRTPTKDQSTDEPSTVRPSSGPTTMVPTTSKHPTSAPLVTNVPVSIYPTIKAVDTTTAQEGEVTDAHTTNALTGTVSNTSDKDTSSDALPFTSNTIFSVLMGIVGILFILCIVLLVYSYKIKKREGQYQKDKNQIELDMYYNYDDLEPNADGIYKQSLQSDNKHVVIKKDIPYITPKPPARRKKVNKQDNDKCISTPKGDDMYALPDNIYKTSGGTLTPSGATKRVDSLILSSSTPQYRDDNSDEDIYSKPSSVQTDNVDDM